MRIIVRLENDKMPKTDNGLIISLLNASRQKTEKHRILSDLNMIVIAGLYISHRLVHPLGEEQLDLVTQHIRHRNFRILSNRNLEEVIVDRGIVTAPEA